jgi:prophage tail gpP-like protein
VATPRDSIRLAVGGVSNDTWTGWSVDSDLLTPADAFELELYAQAGVAWPAEVQEGAPCTLSLDGDRVLTGSIDDIEHVVSRRGHTVRITGRDLAGPLVDCSAPFLALQNVSLEQVVAQVVKPLGVSQVRLQAMDAKVRRRVQIEPGMSAWEALLIAAEANGLWPWVTPDGVLVVGGPDYNAAPVGELLLLDDPRQVARNNVESLAVRRGMAGRYSQVTVLGQHGQFQGDDFGVNRTTLKAEVKDDALAQRGIFRPRVVIDQACDTVDLARDRAQKLIADSALDAFEARALVQGWRAGNGQVWAPGQRVRVTSTPHGLDDIYFIMARTLRLTRSGGALTELRLREDKTWVINAQPVKRHGKHQAAQVPL